MKITKIIRRSLACLLAMMIPGTAIAATCAVPNSIIQVKNSKVGSIEYVDFWVKKPVTTGVSNWNSNTGNFTHDPSGNTISVAGNHWRVVRFSIANWTCSIPLSIVVKPRIKAVKNVGQFEGVITCVIGRQNGNYLGMTITNFSSTRRYRFKFN